MRFILTIGYQKFVLAPGEKVGRLMDVLSKAEPTTSKYVDGKTYFPPSDETLTIELEAVDDSLVTTPPEKEPEPAPEAPNTPTQEAAPDDTPF